MANLCNVRDQANGYWATENLVAHQLSSSGFQFVVCSQWGLFSPILGLGRQDQDQSPYPSFPYSIAPENSGVVFGAYFGDSEFNNAQITFNSIDTSRLSGIMETFEYDAVGKRLQIQNMDVITGNGKKTSVMNLTYPDYGTRSAIINTVTP